MTWAKFVDLPDFSFPTISLGNPKSFGGTPEAYVLLGDGQPQLLIKLYVNRMAFKDAVIWKNWAVIGFGEAVFWVDLQTHESQSYALEGYFGHLYPLEDVLLVASATALWCVSSAGQLRWHTDGLGVDGVLVHNVFDGIIEGDGEFDPPGGWQPFRLELSSGKQL